ncbi:MAG: N-acetyltransferase [Vicinamibacterales bacterium]|nr:N-acetyltransferase [Vicinamibacterales bacterium]
MRFRLRDATADDRPALLALLPRLAAFELPTDRRAEDLWHGDAQLLERFLDGHAPDCFALVAVPDDNSAREVWGLAFVRLQPEPLSHDPSAHLEALVLAPSAEGQGMARALIAAAEDRARERGAQHMTLHVFESNTRARGLYDRAGYAAEILRYRKTL